MVGRGSPAGRSLPSCERVWFIEEPRAEVAMVEMWFQCAPGRLADFALADVGN